MNTANPCWLKLCSTTVCSGFPQHSGGVAQGYNYKGIQPLIVQEI